MRYKLTKLKMRLKNLARNRLNGRIGERLIWCDIYLVGIWTWLVFSLRERLLRIQIKRLESVKNKKISVLATPNKTIKQQPKIIFVSTWFGADIGGGAEAAMLAMARDVHRLAPHIEIEIVSTTLREFSADWNQSFHSSGDSDFEGIKVRRFNAVSRNRRFFHFLNGRYLMGGSASSYLTKAGFSSPISRPAEYYYLRNMIDSPEMLKYLAKSYSETDAFIFMPYLMGPVIAGARVVREKAFLFPCLHDERYAAMGVVKNMISSAQNNFFWVRSERSLCARLYPSARIGGVVGSQVSIDKYVGDSSRGRILVGKERDRFILYAGRQIEGKGLPDLVSKFRAFKENNSQFSDLKLVLIGKGDLDYSEHTDVINLGFVTEQEKADVMSAAVALMQPSLYESFSIVMMESWLQKTPVIVDGRCEVTRNHIEDSGGGFIYNSQGEFDSALHKLLTDRVISDEIGIKGRDYVVKNYSSQKVIGNFLNEVGISK